MSTRVLLFALLGLVAVAHVQAQTFGRLEETESNMTTYYFHVLPGEATVQAYVWGTVRNPGLYEVSAKTTLDKLLSFAGGPILTARQRTDERDIFVRLYREQDGARTLIYETELDSMLTGPGLYPTLQDGDVLTLETVENRGFHWRDIFSVLGGVAALALVFERLVGVL